MGETVLSLVVKAKDLTGAVLKKTERGLRGFAARTRERFARLRAAVFSVRGAIAGLAAGAVLERLAQKFVEKFGIQEEAVNRLRGALIDAGHDGSEALKLLTENATALQHATTQGDESIIAATAALSRMVPALNPEGLKKAQKIVVGLADQFFNGDTERAAQLLGKTLRSSTNALVRYGIELDVTASAQEKVNQLFPETVNFFRAAEDRAKGVRGRLKQLGNAWGDLEEQLGGVIVTAGTLNEDATTLTEKLYGWTEAIKRNRSQIAAWVDFAIQSGKFVGQVFVTLTRLAFNTGQAIGNFIRVATSEFLGHVSTLVNLAIDGLNKVLDGINKIPGVNFDFRIERLPAQAFFRDANTSLEAMKANIMDGVDSVKDLAGAWEDAHQAAGRAQNAAKGVADQAERAAQAGGGGGGGGGGSVPDWVKGPITPQSSRSLGTVDTLATSGLADAPKHLKDLQDQIINVQHAGVDAGKAMLNFGDTASKAFSGALAGAILAADGMRDGFLGALAKMAAGKGAFYLAEAAGALAQGILGDPRGFAAAKQYTVAAGLMFGLAAALGGAAAAVSGGGGAGGAAGGAAANAANSQVEGAGNAKKPPGTIKVVGGLLDMNDPRQARALSAALSQLGDRDIVIEGG